jgi:riboflavin kinase / FMN adenylyltransferase
MSKLNIDPNTQAPEEKPGKERAIAIGNFDGFHLGHRKIINTLKTIAAQKRLQSMIVTFTPNPKVYFDPGFQVIGTDKQKKKILEEQSADHVSIIDFSKIADMSEEGFLKEILIETYHMKHIVTGENFRFGKGRAGDIEFLEAASRRYGFDYTVVQPVMLDGIRISSTRVRTLLSESKIEESNRMLGKKFVIEGLIVEGDKVGRQLGFPTINIETENTLLPQGVFKTLVEIENETFPSISYIGFRPTFQGKEKKVESHIIDFDRDVYGKHVKLYFERRIRGEMKFDSEKSLIKQIHEDIEKLKVDKEFIF